ncbi:hypothetical protein [Actinomadura sp. 9N215]|uniref:hypothetical protein n=1 Tax=Actinomadura sp. 9N215 TaxID=3375150 RepID=UPI0037A552C0
MASYAYVNPMVAVTLGALLGQEPLSPNLLLGGAVIVSAVVLVVNKAMTQQLRCRPTRTKPSGEARVVR